MGGNGVGRRRRISLKQEDHAESCRGCIKLTKEGGFVGEENADRSARFIIK